MSSAAELLNLIRKYSYMPEENYSRFWPHDISPIIQQSLANYSQTDHAIHSVFRKNKTDAAPETIQDIKNILKGMRPLAKNTMLFRGVDGILPSKILSNQSIMSTSSDPSAAKQFGELHRLLLPKGTLAIPANYSSNYLFDPFMEDELIGGADWVHPENEWILPPNNLFENLGRSKGATTLLLKKLVIARSLLNLMISQKVLVTSQALYR